MRPDNGGTMPSKSAPFTPSSILFRPRLRDQSSEVGYRLTSDHSPLMVEAPGTAPGSDRFITTAVYRHSRLAPAPLNISPEPQSAGQCHERAFLCGDSQLPDHGIRRR